MKEIGNHCPYAAKEEFPGAFQFLGIMLCPVIGAIWEFDMMRVDPIHVPQTVSQKSVLMVVIWKMYWKNIKKTWFLSNVCYLSSVGIGFSCSCFTWKEYQMDFKSGSACQYGWGPFHNEHNAKAKLVELFSVSEINRSKLLYTVSQHAAGFLKPCPEVSHFPFTRVCFHWETGNHRVSEWWLITTSSDMPDKGYQSLHQASLSHLLTLVPGMMNTMCTKHNTMQITWLLWIGATPPYWTFVTMRVMRVIMLMMMMLMMMIIIAVWTYSRLTKGWFRIHLIQT